MTTDRALTIYRRIADAYRACGNHRIAAWYEKRAVEYEAQLITEEAAA